MSEYCDEQGNLGLVHHLADHQQAAAVGGFAHHFQAFFAKSLKTVGRAARLECAAADDLGAAVGDDIGAAFDLFTILDTARSGHHDHRLPPISTSLILTMVPPGRKLRLASL